MSAIFLVAGNELMWPSMVYIENKVCDDNLVRFKMDSSTLTGAIIMNTAQNHKSIVSAPRMVIDSTSCVHGIICTNGNVQVSGRVNGTVALRGFFFYLSPTFYIDWLKDAIIDHSILEEDFPVPIGIGKMSQFQIVSWEFE